MLRTAQGWDIEHVSAWAFSVTAAFSAFRYCLGGKCNKLTIREVIMYLECLEERNRG